MSLLDVFGKQVHSEVRSLQGPLVEDETQFSYGRPSPDIYPYLSAQPNKMPLTSSCTSLLDSSTKGFWETTTRTIPWGSSSNLYRPASRNFFQANVAYAIPECLTEPHDVTNHLDVAHVKYATTWISGRIDDGLLNGYGNPFDFIEEDHQKSCLLPDKEEGQRRFASTRTLDRRYTPAESPRILERDEVRLPSSELCHPIVSHDERLMTICCHGGEPD